MTRRKKALGIPPSCHSEELGDEESYARACGGALCKTAAPSAYCEILRSAQNDKRGAGRKAGGEAAGFCGSLLCLPGGECIIETNSDRKTI